MTNAAHKNEAQDGAFWQAVIGAQVLAHIDERKECEVPRSEFRPDYYASDHLCAFQAKMSTSGYTGAQFVKSIYGWGLRYDSGLNDFGIIFSARHGDGSMQSAMNYAIEWVSRAPKERYVMADPEARAAIAKALGA